MKSIAKAILFVEPVLLAIVTIAFWVNDPQYRAGFLLLLIPPMLARLILYRRLWVNVAISLPLYLFLLLCAIDTYVALQTPSPPPYSWGWYEIGRPAMGVALALSMTSIAYERGRLDGALLVAAALALLVGVLGLTSAQFLAAKSEPLEFVIDRLPRINDFPGAVGGFNVNEIGGAMAFFAPLAAGIAFYDAPRPRRAPLRLALAALAFALLALALFLGQSRLSIIGVVVALTPVIVLVIQNRRWRYVALGLLLVFCVIEIGVATGAFNRSSNAEGVSERDETSFAQRPVIWGAALTLIREYPLTGYGLNEFRRREIRDRFVPDFAMTIVPHAHNELLQIGADAGIPGMIVYIAWHVALGVMLWRAWRDGDPLIRAVAVSVAAGLLAHAVFGLADAITLFDRFTWAYWLLVGLGGAAYAVTRGKDYAAEAR